MIKYRYEYRINKKGVECFRSFDLVETKNKLNELKEKRPNVVYTMQSRSCRLDRYGVAESDWKDRPCWSIWN